MFDAVISPKVALSPEVNWSEEEITPELFSPATTCADDETTLEPCSPAITWAEDETQLEPSVSTPAYAT